MAPKPPLPPFAFFSAGLILTICWPYKSHNFNLNHIIISELPEDGNLPDPDQNTMLIDDIEIFTTTYFDIEYEYYILRINQGGSEISPNFSDRVINWSLFIDRPFVNRIIGIASL